MQTVKEIAKAIVAREGGYVNDPSDPGGATKHGVTIGTMRRLGLDLDHDGDVDTSDVRLIDRKLAEQIFVEHYFEKPNISRLPEVLHASVFDMYVNAGRHAVKILQRLLVQMGAKIKIDGSLGPMTIAAANWGFEVAPHHLADAYGIARRNYYYGLADSRPKSRKYARRRTGGKGGWIVRAEEFMSAKYHLTANEHKKRTASWA